MDTELQRLVALGIHSDAEQGVCAYASPMVLVPKKDGGLRICVDYRQVKQQTVKDQYPLPRVHEIFTDLKDAHCFISLALLMEKDQIPVRFQHKQKTALIAHKGLVVFNYMLFGLGKAPTTFPRLMHQIFRDHIGKIVAEYLDDLLIYAFQFLQLQPVFP